MTASESDGKAAMAAHSEAALHRLHEVVRVSMAALGWDPNWRFALVLAHDADPETTAFVSNMPSAERVREVVAGYAQQQQDREQIAAAALKKMREKPHG